MIMRIRAQWLLVVCTAFLPLADNAATSKEEATVIEGRVVDALGKAPKAGVDVVAVALSHRSKTDVRRGATKTEVLQHTNTDAEGRFRLLVRRASPDDISFSVFAFAAGYALDWSSFEPGRAEYQASFSLPPEQPLFGRVIGPRNKPEAQVKVFLVNVRKTSPGDDNKYPFFSAPEGMVAWPKPVLTEGDGRFILHGVPRNSAVQLEVNDERFARQAWETTNHFEITLKLLPPRVVEGTLFYEDTRTAVSGGSIALTSWDEDGNYLGAVDGRTDSQGTFRLRPYYGDFLGITAMSPDNGAYTLLSRRIPWPEGTIRQGMTLALQRTAVAEAKRRDTRKDPVNVPPQEQPAPESVVAAKNTLPSTTHGIGGKLLGRIYAAASFQAKSEGTDYVDISGIIAIDPEDGKWVQITKCQGNSPRVSPDGKQLAFCTERGSKGTVTCINEPNSRPVQIFPKRGQPVWAPDGKSLVVTVSAPAQAEYRGEEFWGCESAKWELGADGSKPRQLPLPPLHDVEDWSPDGRWLATHWDTHSAAGSHLFVMRVDGTGLRQLTGPGYHYNWYPRFSPDGQWILHKHMEKGRLSIRMVDFNGTTVREVLGQAGRAAPETACWSPDGRYIAVLMFNFGDDVGSMDDVANADRRIVIVDVAGTSRQELRLAGATAVTIVGLDWR